MKKNLVTALKVALLVGTALNLINQFRPIISFDLANIVYWKLILNYAVSFSVSLYSALSADQAKSNVSPFRKFSDFQYFDLNSDPT